MLLQACSIFLIGNAIDPQACLMGVYHFEICYRKERTLEKGSKATFQGQCSVSVRQSAVPLLLLH